MLFQYSVSSACFPQRARKTEEQKQQQNKPIARISILVHTEQGSFVADLELIMNEILFRQICM